MHAFGNGTGKVITTIRCLLLLCMVLMGQFAFSDLLVITRSDTAVDDVTTIELVELWLGQAKTIRGVRLEAMDLDEQEPLRSRFYQEVIGMTDRQLKAYWAKRVFMGKGFPPRMLQRSSIENWVGAAADRIGYIDGEVIDATLKIVHRRERSF